jgi:hypothetical protein
LYCQMSCATHPSRSTDRPLPGDWAGPFQDTKLTTTSVRRSRAIP